MALKQGPHYPPGGGNQLVCRLLITPGLCGQYQMRRSHTHPPKTPDYHGLGRPQGSKPAIAGPSLSWPDPGQGPSEASPCNHFTRLLLTGPQYALSGNERGPDQQTESG